MAMIRPLILSLLLCAVAGAQPRVLTLTAGRSAAEATAFTAYRANPLTLRVRLDATRPTATGLDAITAEIRASLTDTEAPLASVSINSPTGTGPFDLTFTGAQTNQDLAGKSSRQCWLVIYSQDDGGETLDVWHAGKLTLLEHGASQTAAAPPNVVGTASRLELEALEETVDELLATQSSFVDGGVVLRRDGSADAYYNPLANTATARGEALETALITAQLTPLVPAQVMLGRGDFRLTDAMAASNPALNTTVAFAPGAAIKYDDPEDAGLDYNFFRGTTRNVAWFGARGAAHAETLTDNWSSFQAAANSLGLHPNAPSALLPSGRRFRTGSIDIPPGRYGFSATWEVSPTVLVQGGGQGGTNLFWLSGAAADAGTEEFLVFYPVPGGVDTNNLFGSGLRDVTLAGNRATNPGGSGVKMSGGQGSHLCNVHVLGFALRGGDLDGVHLEGLIWIADITRGPGLRWLSGGSAGQLIVEHVNAAGATDGSGLLYPAVEIGGGTYHIDSLLGEEDGSTAQTLCRATNTASLNIGTLAMGVAAGVRSHVLLDLRGSTSADVRHVYGSYIGINRVDPGTLVEDRSANSPSGSGVLYQLFGESGSYSQTIPGIPAGRMAYTLPTGTTTLAMGNLGNAGMVLSAILPASQLNAGTDSVTVDGEVYLANGSDYMDSTDEPFDPTVPTNSPLIINNGSGSPRNITLTYPVFTQPDPGAAAVRVLDLPIFPATSEVAASTRTNLGLGSLATAGAAPAGTLTGSTLASNVATGSLRTLGNVASSDLAQGLTVKSSLGDIQLFGGRIESTRSPFYLNYYRQPLDISAGALTIDNLGRIIPNLPTSAAGLPTGALWNDGGTVKVAP